MNESVSRKVPRRKWPWVVGIVVGVSLGALVWSLYSAAIDRRALADLEWRAIDDVEYRSTAPGWLGNVLGYKLANSLCGKRLERLDLKGVSDESLELVRRFQGLRILNLSESSVTDEGVALLAAMRNLEVLRIEGAPITDAALEDIVKLKRLGLLGLDGTLVTDDAMPSLARLRNLRTLELDNTAVTPWGVQPLRAALPSLDVRGDQFILPLIHEAAKQGNLEHIAKQLDEGVDVDLPAPSIGNYGHWEGTTPLMWAAARGKPEAVRFLIDAGADLQAKTPGGMTALMAAAGAIKTLDGDPLGSLKVLIEAGADLEATDDRGRTAIHYACGDCALGEHFDEPPSRLLSAERQAPDPFALLRPDVGGSIGANYTINRFWFARHGDAERLRALIDAGANIAPGTESPALEVAVGSDAERVRVLLEAGADASFDVVEYAAWYGTGEMFALALEASSLSATEYADLLVAAGGYAAEDADRKVRMLLAKGAGEHATRKVLSEALPRALKNEHSCDAATLLLEAGADPAMPEPRKEGEETTLVLAARDGPATALRWLLERGHDAHARSDVPPSPRLLILAAGSKREAAEKVRVLLEHGAQVNVANDEGTTPLLAAARTGNMQAVVVLAESGAEVNVIDSSQEYGRDGMTPLMYTANRGGDTIYMDEETGADAVKALLEAGADPKQRNAAGLTARMLAKKVKNREVVELLNARAE